MNTIKAVIVVSNSNSDFKLWHLRLGHAPDNVLQHMLITTTSSDFKLWHLRLGHVPDNILQHMHITTISSLSNKSCPVCPISKQYKLSFPKHSRSVSSDFFDLIHMNIWGSYHIVTNTGCKYFLTMIDDYTKATWVFLMPTRQHVLGIF